MDILATTNISDNDKKDYSKVVKKFNKYFKVQKVPFWNVPTSNLVSQLADETVEQFITRLHQMVDNCKFGNMGSEIIQDRLVIIIHNQQLSERLQMELELTLATAEKLTRQRAEIGQQQQKLKVPAETKL